MFSTCFIASETLTQTCGLSSTSSMPLLALTIFGSSDKFLSGAMKVVELEEEKTFIAIAISGAG